MCVEVGVFDNNFKRESNGEIAIVWFTILKKYTFRTVDRPAESEDGGSGALSACLSRKQRAVDGSTTKFFGFARKKLNIERDADPSVNAIAFVVDGEVGWRWARWSLF